VIDLTDAGQVRPEDVYRPDYVPRDTYQATVQGLKLERKKSGIVQVSWQFTIDGGETTGDTYAHFPFFYRSVRTFIGTAEDPECEDPGAPAWILKNRQWFKFMIVKAGFDGAAPRPGSMGVEDQVNFISDNVRGNKVQLVLSVVTEKASEGADGTKYEERTRNEIVKMFTSGENTKLRQQMAPLPKAVRPNGPMPRVPNVEMRKFDVFDD
jgi:hypothetical protein